MTLQNFEELLKDKLFNKLPRLPWRLKLPMIATLDVDGFFTPDNPDNKGVGFSAAYGKGYSYGMGDSDATRIPLTEAYMRTYFNDEAMKELEKVMHDLKLTEPFGNCLFNLWGGTCRNYSYWRVNTAENGVLQMHTAPLTEAFYVKLRPYFPEARLQEMQEAHLEEIAFDLQGNSLWIRNGVITGTPAPTEQHPMRFLYAGHKEIFGGTGKYEEATGSFHFSGYGDNRHPEHTGEPNSVGRLGAWGTIEYWWPSARLLSLPNVGEIDLRELVPPLDIYQDNIIQEVIRQEVAAEEMATA